ncbi:MAG: adenosylcobinamide-GDP ribazoletransferase [Candidatus Subteraquimicrobiales bacterium]|nr:adenosylcobinamide-GDP ribazoletransferase [Candidatus Subteraquimicrobiales bacterium]
MKSIIAAFQFLSSIPIKTKGEVKPDVLGKSVAFFPLVGLVFGGVLVVSDWLFSYIIPKIVVDVFLLIILISLDGGMHLDGFMDTCDGFFGGRGDKERILKIMKDSNVGAHGVTCAVCLLLLKFALLYSLSGTLRFFALATMPLLARWSVTLAAVFFPYARDEGPGKVFSLYSGVKEFIVSTIVCLLVVFWWKYSFLSFLGVLLFTLIFSKNMSSRIGGLTGDIYGALVEINEVIVLMLFLIGGRLW